MNWLKLLKTNLITTSISFILLLIACNGILDLYNRSVQQQHQQLIDENVQLEVSMNSLLHSLKNSDLGFRGYYIIPTEQLLHPYTNAIDSFPIHVAQIKTIMGRHGIDQHKIVPVEKAFSDYFKLVQQLVDWRKSEDFESIVEVVASDPGFVVWEKYDTFKKQLHQDMKQITESSQANSDRIMFIATSVRLSLFLLGIPALIILMFSLLRERNRRKQLFKELEENNSKYLFQEQDAQGLQDENTIIENLIRNLKKATSFIANIAKGQFDAKWEGLDDKNMELNRENLAGELIRMREQMVRVKQEDQIRMWATEGHSKFAELVRQHQHDVQDLADKITSEVVKYLNANYATLFFVEENKQKEVELKLYGCYAYDRKKFLEKTIAPGEGLLGQTYLEQEITFLTKIPKDYITISSSLGEATPASLVIVPLKFNDRVEGLLELASFEVLQPHELDFLQKIGEIIASSIVNIRSSSEMKLLMEHLQVQSEEMKAQEEEMRQNMEELQATQEEMARKAREYQEMITTLEGQLTAVKAENMSLKQQLG